MTWIMTATGRKIDFINPDIEQISIDDIVTSLSRNHRFGGFSPLKIAQHIIEVVELMVRKAREDNPDITEEEIAEIVLVGLLHDFPEYVVGDCPTPFKQLLAPLFQNAESALLSAMLNKWSLNRSYNHFDALLKWADKVAVQQEAIRYRLDGNKVDDFGNDIPVPRVWVPDDVEVFLKSDILTEEGAGFHLGNYFMKAMLVSGRGDMLSGQIYQALKKVADSAGYSLLDFLNGPVRRASIGTVFLDGTEAYV